VLLPPGAHPTAAMVTLPAPGGAAAAGGQTARGGGEMGGVRHGRRDRRISQVWMLERNDFFFLRGGAE